MTNEILVKIDPGSVQKNPDAGRAEYAIAGAMHGERTVVTEVGDYFRVEKFLLSGQDQWRLVRSDLIDSRFSALKPCEEIEIGRDVQHVYTMTPAPDYLFDYVHPDVKCESCVSTNPINRWDRDFDEDSGCDWTECPNCANVLDIEVRYERLSDFLSVNTL